MKAATIEMESAVAQAKLAAYREALAGRHSKAVEEEYVAALRGFTELAKGTPLVDPFSVIREAGWRADGRPMLAMARADQRQVEWICTNSRRWDWNEKTRTGTYSGNYAPMGLAISRAANRITQGALARAGQFGYTRRQCQHGTAGSPQKRSRTDSAGASRRLAWPRL